jgi:hypothetical protein
MLPPTSGPGGAAPVGSVVPPGFAALARLPNTGAEGLSDVQWEALIPLLRKATAAAEDCRFAVWDGYGYVDEGVAAEAPLLRLGIRDYVLFSGPLDLVMTFSWAGYFQPPDLCWPMDRAWILVADTDLASSYLAGTESLIGSIIAVVETRASRVSPAEALDGEY